MNMKTIKQKNNQHSLGNNPHFTDFDDADLQLQSGN
jgi:hypothetical protein